MPDSVISSCHIDKHSTGFLVFLNVLRKQNGLIYGRLSVSKLSLFLWGKQEVDYWFDAIVDQSFEDFIRDAKQRNGTVTLWVLSGFEGLGIATTNALLQTFEILSRTGRKEAT